MSIRLSVGDRWRRWDYLQDVDLWLSALPGPRRRAICRELRANLADAAQDIGMRAAIDELGPARDLARYYLDGEPRNRPIWYQGAIAALAVLVLSAAGFAVYTAGMLAAVSDSGAELAEGLFLGVRIVAESSADRLGAQFQGFSWPSLVGCLIAWLLGARVWRLRRHRSATT